MNLRRKNPNRPQQSPPMSSLHKANLHLTQVEAKILSELHHSIISISPLKTPYFTRDEVRTLQLSRIEKLRSQKQTIESKLQNLNELQKKFEEELKNLRQARPKSELTKKQLKQFREINVRHQNHEKQLQKKVEQLQKMKYEDFEREKVEKKIYYDRINQEKQAEITKRLEKMMEKREQRAKRLENQKKLVNHIKSQKRLYEKLQETWSIKQKEQQKKVFEERQVLARARDLDSKHLKQHERKYEEILKKKREELQKKRKEMKMFSYTPKNVNSRFYTMAVENSERSRTQIEEQKELKKEKLFKMWQYGDIVKCNYSPKLKPKVQDSGSEENSSRIKTTLNPEKRKQIGLNYLDFNKKKRNKRSKSNSTNKIEDSVELVPAAKVRYKDYLTETRVLKNKNEESGVQKQRDYGKEVKETRKIMGASGYTQAEKLEQIKMVAERIDRKQYSTKARVVLKKIGAKMKILEVLYGQ